jgi:uncharacterized membrane protein
MSTSYMGSLWGLATILGPILFIAVLLWVKYRNSKMTPREKQMSEQSAVDNREAETAERRAREGKSDLPS